MGETDQLALLVETFAPTPTQGLMVTGWTLPSTLTLGQWQDCGRALARMDDAKQWWLGDWWNAGVEWGEGKTVCDEIGIVYGTAANAGSVAAKIQFSRRRENLTFSHHVEVCAVPDLAAQDRLLLWCEEPLETMGKPRSVRALRDAVRQYLDTQNWTPFERERRRWVEEFGYPTLANHSRDPHLIEWAKFSGRHVYIGRGSKWGNPFEIGKDGDREYVIESFTVHYFPRKPSLVDALPELDGKVLECYCMPERCHGEVFLETLKREAWELLDAELQKGASDAD